MWSWYSKRIEKLWNLMNTKKRKKRVSHSEACYVVLTDWVKNFETIKKYAKTKCCYQQSSQHFDKMEFLSEQIWVSTLFLPCHLLILPSLFFSLKPHASVSFHLFPLSAFLSSKSLSFAFLSHLCFFSFPFTLLLTSPAAPFPSLFLPFSSPEFLVIVNIQSV